MIEDPKPLNTLIKRIKEADNAPLRGGGEAPEGSERPKPSGSQLRRLHEINQQRLMAMLNEGDTEAAARWVPTALSLNHISVEDAAVLTFLCGNFDGALALTAKAADEGQHQQAQDKLQAAVMKHSVFNGGNRGSARTSGTPKWRFHQDAVAVTLQRYLTGPYRYGIGADPAEYRQRMQNTPGNTHGGGEVEG